MFNITFYNFTKQENSTARPSDQGATFNCIIKRGSPLINPIIELDLGLETAPNYNYCYIPAWNRFYYVTEWSFQGALWVASLRCDALATYKEAIGNESLYALRAANSYDGNIIDTLYPTKSGSTFIQNKTAGLWDPFNAGVFIVGVDSKSPNFGSIKYYVLSTPDMEIIINYLLSDKLMRDGGFSSNDASFELQKSLVDPMQFIKSCVFVPLSMATFETLIPQLEDVVIFNWKVKDAADAQVKARAVPKASPYVVRTRNFAIPKHPQTQSRGNFVNTAPYTTITLLIPPFGIIDIDTTVTCNASEINTEVTLDLPTGLGILTISCNGITLNRLETQIGVPVQLSQISRDYMGGVMSIMGAVGNVVAAGVTGGASLTMGGVGGIANGIADGARALMPRSQSIGGGGSYTQLTKDCEINLQFFAIVDDDINKNGRPLCQVIKPANIGGYMIIQDGDVPINGTREEASQIKTYLESGFYYE